MSQKQINHKLGIKELRNEGYEVEIKGNFLLVHSVPYLNANKDLLNGTLVSNVSFDKPENHVVYFIGQAPYDANGNLMTNLINNSNKTNLGNGITIDHMFSHKPKIMYPTYYEKISTYVNILHSQAHHIFPQATAKTGVVVESTSSDSVFHYSNTNSSRVEIDAINEKLSGLKIGIIGLGGTGSYILDKVAKTFVKEIHLFDDDKFNQHNAFRAPGATDKQTINLGLDKVEYFSKLYSKMHRGIVPHALRISEINLGILNELDFVFIAIDISEIKKIIFKKLEEINIPFIDCGLGVVREEDELSGVIRATLSTPNKRDHIYKLISFSSSNRDDYKSNIQIAELNDYNALMAVIKWKKYYGIYNDQLKEHDNNYSINVNTIFNNEV